MDFTLKLRPKPGDGANMIFMGVRDDKPGKIPLVLGDETHIGQNNVNAGIILVPKFDTKINHQPFARGLGASTIAIAIHTDLACAAQGQQNQIIAVVKFLLGLHVTSMRHNITSVDLARHAAHLKQHRAILRKSGEDAADIALGEPHGYALSHMPARGNPALANVRKSLAFGPNRKPVSQSHVEQAVNFVRRRLASEIGQRRSLVRQTFRGV